MGNPIHGSLPGQSIHIYKDKVKMLIGLGVHDAAFKKAPIFTIGFDRSQVYDMLNDVIEVYEELYGIKFEVRSKPEDDLARIQGT